MALKKYYVHPLPFPNCVRLVVASPFRLRPALQSGDHERARTLHEGLLALWNALQPHDILPAATKVAQALQGCPAGVSRAPMSMPDSEHVKRLEHALAAIGALAS